MDLGIFFAYYILKNITIYSSQSIFVYALQFALGISSPVDVPTASNLFSKGNGVWVMGDSPRDTARRISVSLDDLGFLWNPHHCFGFTNTKEWPPPSSCEPVYLSPWLEERWLKGTPVEERWRCAACFLWVWMCVSLWACGGGKCACMSVSMWSCVFLYVLETELYTC